MRLLPICICCIFVGKKTLGGDTKTGLFYVMIRDFGPEETIQCMTRLSKLTSRLLSDRGFSIGNR